MSCGQWNEDWIALLYGEVTEEERGSIEAHLSACEACRGHFAALGRSSELLRKYVPDVPTTPRVVVLRARSSWRMAWAFAGGVAAAAALFAVFLAPRLLQQQQQQQEPAPVETASNPVQQVPQEPPISAAMREDLASLQQRVADIEHAREVRTASGDEMLSREELKQELRAFLERQDAQRAADLQYVLEAVSATEQRLDRNSQALTYLALRESPWVTEH